MTSVLVIKFERIFKFGSTNPSSSANASPSLRGLGRVSQVLESEIFARKKVEMYIGYQEIGVVGRLCKAVQVESIGEIVVMEVEVNVCREVCIVSPVYRMETVEIPGCPMVQVSLDLWTVWSIWSVNDLCQKPSPESIDWSGEKGRGLVFVWHAITAAIAVTIGAQFVDRYADRTISVGFLSHRIGVGDGGVLQCTEDRVGVG